MAMQCDVMWWDVMSTPSRERYPAKAGGTEEEWSERWGGGAAAARKCPTQVSTWPIILPLISMFSLHSASVPALCVLCDTIIETGDWSYYKAITYYHSSASSSSPASVKSGYPLTSNLSIEPTDWSSQYLRKEGWSWTAAQYFSQPGIIFELNLTEQIPNS